jgi:hypothetical protein
MGQNNGQSSSDVVIGSKVKLAPNHGLTLDPNKEYVVTDVRFDHVYLNNRWWSPKASVVVLELAAVEARSEAFICDVRSLCRGYGLVIESSDGCHGSLVVSDWNEQGDIALHEAKYEAAQEPVPEPIFYCQVPGCNEHAIEDYCKVHTPLTSLIEIGDTVEFTDQMWAAGGAQCLEAGRQFTVTEIGATTVRTASGHILPKDVLKLCIRR